jgi:hypothetical protein
MDHLYQRKHLMMLCWCYLRTLLEWSRVCSITITLTFFGIFIMTDANKSISSPRTSSASTPSAPMDAERLKQALSIGLKTLKDSGSKAAAARAIYDLIHMESRDVILQAFIDGATVTVKGAPTYYHTISRKFRRKNAAVSAE